MNKLFDLTKYLADNRKTFKLFTLNKAATDCDVTEMTVRNFEAGKTANPMLLMYYMKHVKEFYDNGGSYLNSEEFDELIETEPAEANANSVYYSKKTFNEMADIFN